MIRICYQNLRLIQPCKIYIPAPYFLPVDEQLAFSMSPRNDDCIYSTRVVSVTLHHGNRIMIHVCIKNIFFTHSLNTTIPQKFQAYGPITALIVTILSSCQICRYILTGKSHATKTCSDGNSHVETVP